MRWQRLLFADWQLKLLGLAVAVGLWAYVRSGEMLRLTVTASVEFRNVPRQTRFAQRPPASVEVTLEAHRDVIPRLSPRDIRAVVDLAGRGSQRRVTITLTPDHIARPSGVAVMAIVPAQLVLELDRAGGD